MTKHTVRWSVIVPTVAGWRGLLGQTFPGLQEAAARVEGEVVVVLDTPTLESSPRAPFDAVVVSTGGGRGYAGACNEGLRHARGSTLLFVNDDVFVEPDLLLRLEELWLSEPGAGAVIPDVWSQRLRRSEAGCFVSSRLGILDTRQEPLAGRTRVDYPCGASVAMQKSVLERIGGWEELYAPGYWEDVDLGLTLRKTGLDVVAAPGLKVRHVHGTSFDALGHDRLRTLFERNRALCSLKHAAPRLLPVTALALFIRGLKGLATDAATARGTWGAFRAIGEVFGARRRLHIAGEWTGTGDG